MGTKTISAPMMVYILEDMDIGIQYLTRPEPSVEGALVMMKRIRDRLLRYAVGEVVVETVEPGGEV